MLNRAPEENEQMEGVMANDIVGIGLLLKFIVTDQDRPRCALA